MQAEKQKLKINLECTSYADIHCCLLVLQTLATPLDSVLEYDSLRQSNHTVDRTLVSM